MALPRSTEGAELARTLNTVVLLTSAFDWNGLSVTKCPQDNDDSRCKNCVGVHDSKGMKTSSLEFERTVADEEHGCVGGDFMW
jgi:hypothetical protein